MHYGVEPGFVPDHLIDDPEQTKAGLRRAYLAVIDLGFDYLLLAHGRPVIGGGKDALRRLASTEA